MQATHDKDDDKIDRDLSWDLDCVSIDGKANSITYTLGTGPRAHENVIAYYKTGCPVDSKLGYIRSKGSGKDKIVPADGGCVDVNDYMVDTPGPEGYYRINSVRFVR
ncbi:MAG: hypothetical protein Q9227_002889 [Pyrenula ochraceoflavens]